MRSILVFIFLITLTTKALAQSTTPDSLFKKIREAKNDTAKVLALIAAAEFHKNATVDSARIFLDQAFKLSTNTNYIRGLAYSERLIGYFEYRNADYNKTLEHYERSLKLFEKLHDQANIGRLTYFIGIATVYLGDYKKALTQFFKALEICEKAGAKNSAADALVGIANVYGRLNQYDKEYEFNMKALKVKEELKDEYGIAAIYINLGKALLKQDKFDEAVDYTKKAIAISERSNNVKWQINGYGNLGAMYSQRRDFKNGLRYMNKCLSLAEAINDKASLGILYDNIGRLHSELGHHDQAQNFYSKALNLAMETHDLEQIKNTYYSFYEYSMDKKDYKNAVTYLKEYIKWKDTLLNQDNTSQLNELQTKYDTDKKEKEIALLNKDKELQNTQIAQQKTINYSIIIGLLVVCVFSILLFNRLKLTRKQKALIELQKKEVEVKSEIIEEKQKEILDSIHYAKRIQNTLLSHGDALNENINSNFIFFKPKDIVSGDFYWVTKKDNLFYLAVCDSTGHGVPGAFMSLLNINFLNEAINEKNITEPNEVFNYVRERLINSVSKEGQQDGFDGILLCLDKKSGKLSYSAAHNAPVIIRNGVVKELAKDKMPVGKGEKKNSFTSHELQLEANDTLYLYTDGYADQFGGPNGKKFLYKRMNELLASLDLGDTSKCLQELSQTFDSWKGELEQVDDVLVIGIKV
jgi:serine phosphatase RsbU (regulator of sigma subunit)